MPHEAIWFYGGMALITAFWTLSTIRPQSKGEWLAFVGIVAAWPAFIAYAAFFRKRPPR
jgi:hypothetical protein